MWSFIWTYIWTHIWPYATNSCLIRQHPAHCLRGSSSCASTWRTCGLAHLQAQLANGIMWACSQAGALVNMPNLAYMAIWRLLLFLQWQFGWFYHNCFYFCFVLTNKYKKYDLGLAKRGPWRIGHRGDPAKNALSQWKLILGPFKVVSRPLDARNGSGSKFCIGWR